jgi:hypothetical protein
MKIAINFEAYPFNVISVNMILLVLIFSWMPSNAYTLRGSLEVREYFVIYTESEHI